MEGQTELIQLLKTQLAIDLSENITFEELKSRLSAHINHLIQHNFQQLVAILYRVDVSEQKLKTLLSENAGTDAGSIIAKLIIERELQKIKSRKENNKRPDIISGDEAW